MKRDESVTGRSVQFRLEDLAIADPDTGQLGKSVAGRALRVPGRVWIQGAKLHWLWGGEPVPAEDAPAARGAQFGVQASWMQIFRNQLVYPSKEMLNKFLSLSDGTDADILAFAKRWGPLGICEHGVPHTHWPLTPWNEHVRIVRGGSHREPGASAPPKEKLEVLRPWCHAQGAEETWRFGGWEPLAAWRSYASEARTIATIADQLHRKSGHVVSLDRQTIVALTGQDWLSGNTLSDHMEVGWEVLQPAVDRWLGLGDVRIYLHPLPENGGLAIRFGTAGSPIGEHISLREVLGPVCGLFGALAVQLLLCVHVGGLAICSECQNTYDPGRRPRRDAPPYCPECAPRAGARARAKKSRAKRTMNANRSTASLKTREGQERGAWKPSVPKTRSKPRQPK